MLNKYNDNNIGYYDGKNEYKEVNTDEFLEKWTGICLLAERSEASIEPRIPELKKGCSVRK